jgi:rubrerythrin
MFNKQDYIDYFNQLYDIEIEMKKDTEKLLAIIDNPEARKIIEAIRSDEIKHAEIVKEMIKLID